MADVIPIGSNSAASDRSTIEAIARTDGTNARGSGFPRGFGEYTLLRSIGHGYFADVFLAHHDRSWDLFALKVLSEHVQNDPVCLRRFELEARIGTELRHPHIVSVIDRGSVDGRPFLAMPFIEGEDLLRIVAKRPMPPRQAAELLRLVAQAIDSANRMGYLHRDLKPANILVERATGKPYVADFGLAKDLAVPLGVSGAFDMLGTRPYMAPEQADPALGEVTRATDVYGLGATLYQALTGATPFPRPDRPDRDLHSQIANDLPLPPSTLVPQIHPDIDRICLTCLQKSPFARYQSAGALAEDLARFEQGRPVHAAMSGKGGRWFRLRQSRPTRSTGVVIGVATAIGVALIALGGWKLAGTAPRWLTGDSQRPIRPKPATFDVADLNKQRMIVDAAIRRSLNKTFDDDFSDEEVSGIATLDFRDTPLTDAGASLLADPATGLTGLKELNLWTSTLTNLGLTELCRPGTALGHLESLDLDSTNIDDDGLATLALPDTGLPRLTRLDLSNTIVGDRGMKALARADTGLKRLQRLWLVHTRIKNEGIKTLADPHSGADQITSLDILDTRVTSQGLLSLVGEESGLKFLSELRMRPSSATATGFAAIRKHGITITEK